jgi:2-keto-3-deoxy-L-rhamnonate aldolase RhmA
MPIKECNPRKEMSTRAVLDAAHWRNIADYYSRAGSDWDFIVANEATKAAEALDKIAARLK